MSPEEEEEEEVVLRYLSRKQEDVSVERLLYSEVSGWRRWRLLSDRQEVNVWTDSSTQ